MAFIDEHRDEFGVEPIVRALQETHARIAVSSYYAFKESKPSARARRDAELMGVIAEVYEANYSCYGVRKMWKEINREYGDRFGHVARCTIERLMGQLGISGVRRPTKRPKTASASAEECPEDLVERKFTSEVRTVYGLRISPMCRRSRAGCTRRLSRMRSIGRSLVGR